MATLYETVDTLIKERLGETDHATGMYQLDAYSIQVLFHEALNQQNAFTAEILSFDWEKMTATFFIPDMAKIRGKQYLIIPKPPQT